MIVMTPIRDLAEQIRGVTYGKEEASSVPGPGRVAVLRAGNIQESGLVLEDMVYVPEARVSDKQLLRKNDIVIATSSGSLDVVGKAAATSQDLGMAFGAFCKVLRPRTGIEPRYFAHYFRTSQYRHAVRQMAAGANINNLRNEHLDDLLVPMPPREEQRRIADILDKAEAIRRKRKQAIALTDELLRSAFLDMFGDPATNPKGWERVSLVHLARVTTGNTPSRAIAAYFGDDIEWIKSDNINTPSHYLTRAAEGLSSKGRAAGRTVPAGSSLVTCIAGSPDCIGNVALADREVAFNQQINAVTPREGVDHRFVYALLLVGKRLVQAASTNSMKGMVSKGKLEEMQVPAPPTEDQRIFGDVFDRVLRLSRRQDVALRESEDLFAAATQMAFEGQLFSVEPQC